MIQVHISYTPLSPQSAILLTRAPHQDAVISEAIGALHDARYAHPEAAISMETLADPGNGTVYRWMVPLRQEALTYEHLSGMAALLWELLSELPDYEVTYQGEHPEGWAREFFDEMN